MRSRRPLSHLLLASHTGLVLLFLGLLLATGLDAIRSAVVAEARSEAERAVSESGIRLREWQRELDVGADLLAEQPTLRFYLERKQLTKARALLRDFHSTSELEFLRVAQEGRTVAQIGVSPPSLAPGFAFDRQGMAWRIVQRPVEGLPSAVITIAEKLGSRLDRPSGSPFIASSLLPLRSATTAPDAWQRALLAVSTTGEPRTLEAVGTRAAVRLVALRDGMGVPRALLASTVAQDWVDRRTLEWVASLGLSALITVGLALGVAILVAARISRPFEQLAREADRLGSGDLLTPIASPDTFLTEPVTLAAGLERMRERVATLTASERSQREELDAILDGVDEGIIGIDGAQRVHYANRQFLALVGREREAVLGHGIGELMQAAGPVASSQDVLPEIGSSRERFAAVGSLRPMLVRRQSANGERQVLVVREENALEAARAMRDRILANLSHEFQTPLSAQMASIEMLRDHLRGSTDGTAVQLADAQFRGALRLSQLVDNLLDSVRIESGEMRLRRQSVDLAGVVKEAIDLIRPLTDQREQCVVPVLTPGPALTGDPQRLFSVMVNLLANANKFSPDGSSIRVRMEWEPERVTVWVEDEGPGLPVMHAEADLFAPFRRSPDDEPGQRGTGLGLAIVKAIVVAHGGDVLVSGPGIGQDPGAAIGIWLPLGDAE